MQFWYIVLLTDTLVSIRNWADSGLRDGPVLCEYCGQMLVITNLGKQAISFGMGYGVLNWVLEHGMLIHF